MILKYFYIFSLPLFWTFTLFAQQPALEFNQDTSDKFYASLEVKGLSSESLLAFQHLNPNKELWQKIFSVYRGSQFPTEKDKPSILGNYSIENGLIRFSPRFPFVSEQVYFSRFDLKVFFELIQQKNYPDMPAIQLNFTLPKTHSEKSVKVLQIFPSQDKLPENQLKLYLHFSTPIQGGKIMDYIHLFDETGKDLKSAFLPVPQELWDKNQQRLTLFFDPGRIKRGLKPHLEEGMPLQEGKNYRLVIDADLKDIEGNTLIGKYEKEFVTVAADRNSPDYTRWEIIKPKAQSYDTLILNFPEALDRALLEKYFVVLDNSASQVLGKILIKNQEKQWNFIPEKEWQAGKYKLQIHTRLEDLAGNNLRKLFDTDMKKEQKREINIDLVYREFEIK